MLLNDRDNPEWNGKYQRSPQQNTPDVDGSVDGSYEESERVYNNFDPYRPNGTGVHPNNTLPKDVDNPRYDYAPKSRLIAGLLGILLGGFGVHNFYLGYKMKGTLQVIIACVFFFITPFASFIWGFIEGIYILVSKNATDKKGNYLI